jgi:hypothetical protein
VGRTLALGKRRPRPRTCPPYTAGISLDPIQQYKGIRANFVYTSFGKLGDIWLAAGIPITAQLYDKDHEGELNHIEFGLTQKLGEQLDDLKKASGRK